MCKKFEYTFSVSPRAPVSQFRGDPHSHLLSLSLSRVKPIFDCQKLVPPYCPSSARQLLLHTHTHTPRYTSYVHICTGAVCLLFNFFYYPAERLISLSALLAFDCRARCNCVQTINSIVVVFCYIAGDKNFVIEYTVLLIDETSENFIFFSTPHRLIRVKFKF